MIYKYINIACRPGDGSGDRHLSATLAEKIIARACGRERVRAGEILTARLDLLMMHDSGGPRRVASRLEKLGARVWDPD